MDVMTLMQILQNADAQARADSPYSPITDFANIARQGMFQIPGAKPKDMLMVGLLSGLAGGGGKFLTNRYANRQTGMARDVLSEALTGASVDMPEGMNPSIFRSMQNTGSLFQAGKAMQEIEKQRDADRAIKSAFAREGITFGEDGSFREDPTFAAIMDERANRDARRSLQNQMLLRGLTLDEGDQGLSIGRIPGATESMNADMITESPLVQSLLSKLRSRALGERHEPIMAEEIQAGAQTDAATQRVIDNLVSQINIGSRFEERESRIGLQGMEGIYTQANKLANDIPAIAKAREVLPEIDRMEILLDQDFATAKELFDLNLMSTIGGRGGKLTEQGLQRLKNENIISDVNSFFNYWTAYTGTTDTEAQKTALRGMLADMREAYSQGAERGFQEVENIISRQYGVRLDRDPNFAQNLSAFIQGDLGSSYRTPARTQAAEPAGGQPTYTADQLRQAGYSEAEIEDQRRRGFVQ